MKRALFLCNKTRNLAKPWADAGYECWLLDIQHPRGVTKDGHYVLVGADIHEVYKGHRWMPPSADFAFANPDCTMLTISGNRWQRERGPGGVGRGLLFADSCWRLLQWYGAPYGMENPAVGRLSSAWCKPDHTFHPWEYAGYLDDPDSENTTKITGLWTGNGFVMPPKRPLVGPHRNDCFLMPPSDDRADLRSETPMGFALAVYQANVKEPH